MGGVGGNMGGYGGGLRVRGGLGVSGEAFMGGYGGCGGLIWERGMGHVGGYGGDGGEGGIGGVWGGI